MNLMYLIKFWYYFQDIFCGIFLLSVKLWGERQIKEHYIVVIKDVCYLQT